MFIYKIENIKTKECYIGQTVLNPNKRKNKHFYRLRKNRHPNKHLQNSWNKHGKDNFSFEVIDECKTKEELDLKEKEWIKKDGDFNFHIGGSTGGFTGKHTKETKQIISKKNSKVVYKYSLDGEYICSYDSVKKASLETNISKGSIGKCAREEQETAGNYQWSYSKKKKIKPVKSYEEKQKNIRQKALTIARKKWEKPVKQLTKDNKIVSIYKSAKEASKQTEIDHSSICKCCKGKRKTAGGYKWNWAIENKDLIM